MGGPSGTFAERVWNKIEKTETCWIWTGAKDGHGYGRIASTKMDPGPRRWCGVHRVVYEIMVGPIPDGMVLDHLREICGNVACCNPAHLEPVTQRENLQRSPDTLSGKEARRTHFKCGHSKSSENITWDNGSRRCKPCRREYHRAKYGNEYQRAWRARKKSAMEG